MKRNQKFNDSVSRLLYRAPYCDIIMMARFSGCGSKESLEAALSKARAKYPLLNSRISQDDNGNTEFMYDYSHNFPITVFDNKSDTDWLNLAWDEQKQPFDLQNGPLIKFLLIHTVDTTDLVIICHHCICDGLSLTYLVRDIALFLEDPDVEVQMLPIPPTITKDNLSVNISMGVIGFLIKIVAKCLNRSWNKSKVVFTGKDYEQAYREYWQTKNVGLLPFSLPKEITAALIDKCHAENVTVNSALTTAFSLAQYDLQGNKQPYLKKALLAMSIRHLFKTPPGENFGLLAVGNEINLPFGKEGFWSVAGRFNKEAKEMLANPKKALALMAPLDYIEPTLFDAIYFVESGVLKNKAAERLRNIVLTKTGTPKRSLDITNLGVVKGSGSNLETIFFVPILSGNYEKTLGIVTIDGVINLLMMFDHSVIGKDMAERYKQGIVDIITEAVK